MESAIMASILVSHLAAIHLFAVVFTHPKIKRTLIFKQQMEKELEILRLKEKIRCLEETIQQQNDELKEATKLLIKTRPHPRPPIPHDRKL